MWGSCTEKIIEYDFFSELYLYIQLTNKFLMGFSHGNFFKILSIGERLLISYGLGKAIVALTYNDHVDVATVVADAVVVVVSVESCKLPGLVFSLPL